nr:MAG TPA: hypothetical protein [Ackermannviridae sp.]
MHQGGTGASFLWGCPAAGGRGQGVPPYKGRGGAHRQRGRVRIC